MNKIKKGGKGGTEEQNKQGGREERRMEALEEQSGDDWKPKPGQTGAGASRKKEEW